MFYILAAAIVLSSIFAVTSRRMLRAATWLLVVLICTAGLYLLLNYHFLAAVQLSVYAGGILILFIFAILLTSSRGDKTEPHDRRRVVSGLTAAAAGLAITTLATLKGGLLYGTPPVGDAEIPMKDIGNALLGTGRHQYLLPFETLSVLLLVCAVGAILIARKR
jgi:NADH-quinone oxidoreductase subunit J